MLKRNTLSTKKSKEKTLKIEFSSHGSTQKEESARISVNQKILAKN